MYGTLNINESSKLWALHLELKSLSCPEEIIYLISLSISKEAPFLAKVEGDFYLYCEKWLLHELLILEVFQSFRLFSCSAF